MSENPSIETIIVKAYDECKPQVITSLQNELPGQKELIGSIESEVDKVKEYSEFLIPRDGIITPERIQVNLCRYIRKTIKDKLHEYAKENPGIDIKTSYKTIRGILESHRGVFIKCLQKNGLIIEEYPIDEPEKLKIEREIIKSPF